MALGLLVTQQGTTNNSFEPMTINENSGTILAKLWIIVHQLEEIKTQFALYLDQFHIPKPSSQPSQPVNAHPNQSATH